MCVTPGDAFTYNDPSSAEARAWRYIDDGYATKQGSFKHDDLKLSAINYEHNGASVEVYFYVVPSFKSGADSRLNFKLLAVEMDKTGKFISAATADGSEGVTTRPVP